MGMVGTRRGAAFGWVAAAGLVAGCDLLIGADFDDAHPTSEDGASSTSSAGGATSSAGGATSSASASPASASSSGGDAAGGASTTAGPGGSGGEGGAGGGDGGSGGEGGAGGGDGGSGDVPCEPEVEDGNAPGDESCDGLSGEHLWSWNAGFGVDDRTDGVARDASGDLLICGRFQGSIDLGGENLAAAGGASDIFVARLDARGAHLWSRRFGSAEGDIPAGIALDPSGDVFVAGMVQAPMDFGGPTLDPGDALKYDVVVAKLAGSDGSHVWSRRYGDPSESDRTYAIAADDVGSVAVGGRFLGTLEFVEGEPHSPGNDAFVAKIDGAGEAVWSTALGGPGEDVVDELAFDADGDLWVVGTFTGAVDLGGGPVGQAGVTSVVLAKLDGGDGSHLFSVALGPGAHYAGADVIALPAGDVVATAGIIGTVDLGGGSLPDGGGHDAVIVRLTREGAHVWSRRFGGARDQDGRVLAAAADGGLFLGVDLLGDLGLGLGLAPVVGPRSDDGGEVDAVLVRLASSGEPLWARTFSGSGKQAIRDLAAEPEGGVFVAAESDGSVSWGGALLTSVGGNDAVAARFGP